MTVGFLEVDWKINIPNCSRKWQDAYPSSLSVFVYSGFKSFS